jgi:hypothetical protein
MIGGVAVLRTRHGLRCRPRVTASAQSSSGRTGRPRKGAQLLSWDASGRTPPRLRPSTVPGAAAGRGRGRTSERGTAERLWRALTGGTGNRST